MATLNVDERDIRVKGLIVFALALLIASLAYLIAREATADELAPWTPVCRHQAVSCALLAEEKGYPAEICAGPTPRGGWHAQARYRVDDEWRWLHFNLAANRCEPGPQEITRIAQADSVEAWRERITRDERAKVARK